MYAGRYELEEPEPSPLFEISYNDEFPLARRKVSRRRAETIHDIPEGRTLSNFSFDSISSFIDDDNLHLNHGFASDSNIPCVKEFNENLVEKLQPIYEDIMDKENATIDYNILADAEHYSNFIRVARDIQNVDPSKASVDDRLALFLNVYNMMVLHMTNKYGPPQDLWQRRKLVNTTYYQVHEHRYSLHSILNGILRSNRRGHGMLWKPLGKEDLRLPLVMPKCDPLVHFAIISCSKSSPSLRLFDGANVRQQMVENAVAYLLDNKNMLVDRKRQTLYIPKVFKWYAVDFGNCQEATVEWILNLLEEDETEKSYALRKMCYNEGYSVEYTPYDWEFNGTEQHHE